MAIRIRSHSVPPYEAIGLGRHLLAAGWSEDDRWRGLSEIGHTNALHPPLDVRRTGGGTDRWEPDGAYSYATLEASLDLASLASHYAAQLEEAGWSRTDEGQCGPQAWSAWTLSDEEGRPWIGTLTTLRFSGTPEGTPTRYLLQIHAGLTREQPDGPTHDAE